jgi:putative tryptophan/tyrosine transport system substrate-binding protein
LAADLVGRKVALIAACGGAGEALVAKRATATIPIVFTTGADPIANGLVTSLARPGGNLTGVTLLNVPLMQKRFELISELVQEARLIVLLVNPTNPAFGGIIESAREAAGAKGLQLQILRANTTAEIDVAFATLVRLHAGALIVADVLFDSRSAQIAALAALYKVPTIGIWRKYVADGGLISYSANIAAGYRQVGLYAGKILNGARPGDLPVQQPTGFDLVINLKTAKALGLTMPPSILARADEVIE